MPLASIIALKGNPLPFLPAESLMASSFSIMRSHLVATSPFTLHEEISSHTGNAEEAASILRGILRLGGDSSIRRYEMTPTTTRRTYAGAPPVTWSVRAVRP